MSVCVWGGGGNEVVHNARRSFNSKLRAKTCETHTHTQKKKRQLTKAGKEGLLMTFFFFLFYFFLLSLQRERERYTQGHKQTN